MIFKSIRWRLQVWYGALLVAVLAGFGITAYQLERSRQMETVDKELQIRLQALAGSLQARNTRGFPPPGSQPDEPPPGEMPDGPPQRPMPMNFKLSPAAASLFGEAPATVNYPHADGSAEPFGGNHPAGYYYYIRRRDGQILSASSNAPPEQLSRYHTLPSHSDDLNALPSIDAKASEAGSLSTHWKEPSGPFRELPMMTPPGELLVAGRYLDPITAELDHFKLALIGIGVVVSLLGLAGGWWLVTGAIRPIEDISATAVKIAAGDLAQRINVEDTENELGRLATVLNSTFARLDAAFAQQGQFTADAAHELRTPVTVILTQTQMALKRERDAAEYRATIEACERAAQRMRRLLESLLELTRLDAGQEPMKQRRFDLAQVVGDCVEMVQPLANERGVTIHSELPPLESSGDAERLAQVFTNLLTNAIQYNREHGEVRVSVQRQNDSALVTVTNTGPGISAEDLPRVFERFYRADKARTGTAVRNGLGLSISKAIVEAHGGAIEAASEPGKSATFVVRLPLSDALKS